MLLYGLLTFALAAIPPVLSQQPIVYDSAHNVTPIIGTWASGSKNVVTGQFANPANLTFNYPPTTGMSFSFADNGWYEVARYRFNGNGSQPQCITGVLNWHHGIYQLLDNGSIVLIPNGDGYQQIQDPCAAQSDFIELYNDTELYQSWQIYQDPTDGLKLQLFQFDGSPLPPQSLVFNPPNMLPNAQLRNVTPAVQTSNLLAVNNAGSRSWSPVDVMSLVSGVFAIGVASLLL
ncbi:chaperone for protein-folding within the ER, fungal-domain-containing protein [Trametes punicea]|nr:chaperone for protein-folding within the ER, fungal-domain-containing protein [Trametes punicea]